jgi:hypothetical protein
LAPLLAVLLVAAAPLGGCRRAVNPVADYLDNAELQCETEAQKQNIMRALNDVLTLSGQELAMRRYEDYTGKADEWDLPTLIHRHFVPDRKGKTLGSRFYTDAASARVQAQVRRILDRLSGADTTSR